MQLFIARHGETDYNAEGRIQGGIDTNLSEKGILQAKALGKTLEGMTFDAVYSSPLKRAQQTIEYAFDGKHKPILDPRLVEIGFGEADGMLWEEIMEIYPQAALTLFSDPPNYIPPPKGEALPDMISRVSAFMDDISKSGHQKVFVLTHGYTLRVFHACAADKSLEAIGKSRAYNNCELVYYQHKNNQWELIDVKPNEGEVLV